jgi:hypothetical protein
LSELVTPVLGHSGLNDAERSVLIQLAVEAVAIRDDVPRQDARDLLDQMASHGRAYLVGDDDCAAVLVDGEPVVALRRASLRDTVDPGHLDGRA